MSVVIKELSDEFFEMKLVKNFLFGQIKNEYGYGYVPEYHKDIICMDDYYVLPKRNDFFLAIDDEKDKIVGSIAVRAYDKSFKEFEHIYNGQYTASIWRLFVDRNYRRCGLASELFRCVENFCYLNNYKQIYLHTHKDLGGALQFWKKMGFEIIWDTNNELQTVHMEKKLADLSPTILTSKPSVKS